MRIPFIDKNPRRLAVCGDFVFKVFAWILLLILFEMNEIIAE